jgi:alpha-glucosidase (family GH31 glycosyl hydrolase)
LSYDIFQGKKQINGNQTLSAPLDHINLHVRGGYILPKQNLQGALNTKER